MSAARPADADRVSVVWAVVDAVLYGGTAGGALWLVLRYLTAVSGTAALVVAVLTAVVVGAGVGRYGPPTVPVRWETSGQARETDRPQAPAHGTESQKAAG